MDRSLNSGIYVLRQNPAGVVTMSKKKNMLGLEPLTPLSEGQKYMLSELILISIITVVALTVFNLIRVYWSAIVKFLQCV